MKIWLDGVLSDVAAARIDPADRGFLLGDGVFETIRISGGTPAHFGRHLARLRLGAGVLGIVPPYDDAALLAAVCAVLDGMADGVLRITLTRGPAPRGVPPPAEPRPTLLITAGPPAMVPPPARAVIASVTRRNEHSPLCRIKCLNYLDSILARQEAAAAGADEAILRNTAGFVAEASAGNLFVLRQGVWRTPPISDGALPGIARALLLEAGVAQEARLTVDDLARADAAFVSSALGLRPLASLDGRLLDLQASQPFFEKRTKNFHPFESTTAGASVQERTACKRTIVS